MQKQEYTQSKSLFYNGETDTVSTYDQASQFYTTNQREVYEKGGITPDRYKKVDDIHFVVTELWRSSLVFNFAVDYHRQNQDWTGEIGITDEIFNQFITFTQSEDFEYLIEGENELNSFLDTARESDLPQNIVSSGEELLSKLNARKESDIVNHKSEIKKILLSEMAEKYYGTKDKIKYSLNQDDQLHEAIDVILNEGEYKKILAIK